MSWFVPLAFVAIAIYGVCQINPLPPYESSIDLFARVIGSIFWFVIFIGAAITSARKNRV